MPALTCLIPFPPARFLVPILLVGVWVVLWKILGLWFSARNGNKKWFLFFALVNVLGVAEIYYLHNRRRWPWKKKGG